jgi:hypothetical protein
MSKSILVLILSAIVATGASAQSKEIDKLNFIYKKGYKMHLSGEQIVYDSYNFPKSKSQVYLEYSVTDEKKKGKENVMRFQSQQGNQKDTMTFASNLYINNDGMFMWLWDEEKKLKEKTKTQPISLPMRVGKVWDSYYDNKPAKMECLSTDSLIKTPLGEFKTFVVKVTFTDKSQKDYDTEITMVDFYDDKMGEVGLQMSASAFYKQQEVRKKMYDMSILADKVTTPE